MSTQLQERALQTAGAPATATPVETPQASAELATELNRIETTERAGQDRRQQEELARQRELARFD